MFDGPIYTFMYARNRMLNMGVKTEIFSSTTWFGGYKSKKKVKLPLCLTNKHYAMKAYG
jgi:hypothetical protein